MNVEDRIHSSSSSSSESDNDSSRNSSRNGDRSSQQLRENDEEVADSTSSHTKSKSFSSSISSVENFATRKDKAPGLEFNGLSRPSGSEDSGKGDAEVSSLISTESEEIPTHIPSASSSVVTDIEITSPKNGKSSSSDEELLREFRIQQANRRYRPRSAKVKYKTAVEPKPETVQKYQTHNSDTENKRSPSLTNYLSGERSDSSERESEFERSRKRSASSSSDSTVEQQKLKRPQISSSSDSSTDVEQKLEPQKLRQSPKSKPKSQSSSSSSSSSSKDKAIVTQQAEVKAKPEYPKEPKHRRKPGASQKINPKIRPPQPEERPPSRQEQRRAPVQTRGRPRTRSKPAKDNLDNLLRKKSKPLPTNPRENWPKEPGFWWPYDEDRGERELRRLVTYHRRKLKSLLAQEYLQRHLEIELKKAGAQFTRYERPPRSLSPKQVQKYKERDISWIYLDGNLYNLKSDSMGLFMTKDKNGRQVQPRKARSGSTSLERGSKSSERSKRSVSFEKGSGRRRRSADKRPKSKLKKGLSSHGKKGRKKHRSSSSSKDSRKSSLSSREGSRQSRDSSKSSKMEYGRGGRSQSGIRSRSLSSSRSSASSRKTPTDNPPRPKSALSRPKTAKPKLRSLSSASRSSAEASNSKKGKNRASSSSGAEGKSRSRESSRNKRSSRNRIDDSTLEKVLFTEEFEKTLQRKERQIKKQKKESTSKAKISRSKETDQSDDEDQSAKVDSSHHATKHAPRNDYNFYRNPNIPGHAFPHYYLSQLLSSQSTGRKKRHESTQYVLLPAPVNRPPAWKKYSYKPARTQRKQPAVSARTASKSRRKKTKSIINQTEKAERSLDESRCSSPRSNSPAIGSHPRIRPGSGPIKCSWKAQDDSDQQKFSGSDYQLKNTDNPAIRSWLKRKDAQLRARRQDEMRTQRRKTAKLIDEQNDLDDKHEQALKQYEIWKKNKDREILLRRRKEVKEASSASFIRRQDGQNHSKRAGANVYHHTAGGSAFSELRSSSARPVTADATQRKSRPKSANAAGVTMGSRDKHRPRSATQPRSDSSQASQSLFESVLDDGSRGEASNNNSRDQINGNEGQSEQNENKAAYERWVRSKKSESRKRKDKRSTKRSSTRQLPPHNHTDNELISKLAKRRIDIILANKKSVDTGLNRRPASASVKSKGTKKSTRRDPTHRKWKLRDDDVIKPAVTFATNKKSSSSSSSSNSSGDERAKFSYRKRSPATSSRHERNPVVREAVSTLTTTQFKSRP